MTQPPRPKKWTNWTLTAKGKPHELVDALKQARARRLELANGYPEDLDVEADITAAIGIAGSLAEVSLGEPYVSAIIAGHRRRDGSDEPSSFYVSVTGTMPPAT